jgi:hypothetical protein
MKLTIVVWSARLAFLHESFIHAVVSVLFYQLAPHIDWHWSSVLFITVHFQILNPDKTKSLWHRLVQDFFSFSSLNFGSNSLSNSLSTCKSIFSQLNTKKRQ